MALPSSPPHPACEIPSSPPLLPTVQPALLRTYSLKRQFTDSGNLSSDPVFSEDASEVDVVEYEERRKRKRIVRGPWWCHADESSVQRKVAKKNKMRNVDSGVWMGSDASEDTVSSQDTVASEGSTISSSQRMRDLSVADRTVQTSFTSAMPSTPTAAGLADRIVAACLDQGKETVDLSDLGIDRLADSTLQPLHQLVRQVHTDALHPPSEEEFAPLTPSIKLFLFGNKLAQLPSELFRLENISVLSVRNNQISDLPPSIGKLKNLKELNVAGNGMKCLPWELLDLMRCDGGHRQITVRPNPLYEIPMNSTGHLFTTHHGSDGALAIKEAWKHASAYHQALLTEVIQDSRGRQARSSDCEVCGRRLICLATSTPTMLGIDGSVVRPSVDGDHIFSQRQALPAEEYNPSRVNALCPGALSLFELAVQSAQRSFDLSSFENDEPDVSRSVSSALRRARRGDKYGNQACSTCGRSFIIVRAEWLEYWHCASVAASTPDSILPFLRRACSWACAVPTPPGTCKP